MEDEFSAFLSKCFSLFEAPQDSGAAWTVAETVFREFGDCWISYGVTNRSMSKLYAYRTNLDQDLIEAYTTEDMARFDYVAQHCVSSTGTLVAQAHVPLEEGRYEDAKPAMDALFDRFGIRFVFAQPFREAEQYGGFMMFLRSPEVLNRFGDQEFARRFRLAAMLFKSAYDFTSDPQSYTDNVNFRKYGVLSHREREVLGCLANGLQIDQIAYHLEIKPVTVKKHLASAKTKLEARSREQALSLALRHGLIHPETFKVSI